MIYIYTQDILVYLTLLYKDIDIIIKYLLCSLSPPFRHVKEGLVNKKKNFKYSWLLLLMPVCFDNCYHTRSLSSRFVSISSSEPIISVFSVSVWYPDFPGNHVGSIITGFIETANRFFGKKYLFHRSLQKESPACISNNCLCLLPFIYVFLLKATP